MQQGRVQLDADWNEQLDIQAHLDHATSRDVIGACGVPEVGGGFELNVLGGDLSLTPGRIYVEGILCENLAEEVAVVSVNNQGATLTTLLLDGAPPVAGQWLEIAVPVVGAPPTRTQVQIAAIANGALTFVQPVTAFPVTIQQGTARRVVTYLTQPDLPTPLHSNGGTPPVLQLSPGAYLAYLDVWERSLTAVEDPSLREPALAGPDTAFRTHTVWQLELMPIPQANAAAGCKADFPDWDAKINPSRGTLAARAKAPDQASGDPICILPAGSRYNGLENQLYRVEIHKPGKLGTATFKWSRENGSVEAAWTDQSGTEMKVSSTGRDGVLGFTGAGSIELVDNAVELSSVPDPAGLIAGYTVADDTTLTLPAGVNTGKAPKDRLNPRIRRWENTTEVLTSSAWVPIERGVEVAFSDGAGVYQTGDYWLIPARTPSGADTGDVEWPVDPSVKPADDPSASGTPVQRQPDGIRHHFCKLAVLNKSLDKLTMADCRVTFPSLTTLDAEDIAFTGSAACVGAGDTVESALEFLCADSDDRGHNRHLHGTGIVDGLQVQCGADSTSVHVKAGYAIAPDGGVVDFIDVPAYGLVTAAQAYDSGSRNGKIITDTPNPGDGEASLYLGLTSTNAWGLFVEPYDPTADTPASALNGTMLMDLYNDCIKKLQDWLKGELTDPGNTSPASKADQLRSALTNLGAQFVRPNTGQNIFLSLREHKLLAEFYAGLKLQLQSHTFCAMFTGSYPKYTDFPALNGLGMDTIFGKGEHTRLRLRPGTKEAYTVGPGLNPLKPSTTLNRYDLTTGELVNVYDALAGVDLKSDSSTSSGADSAQDVAFIGSNIWVIIPTRDGQNTILRWGVFVGSSINWNAGGWTSLCGVKLVTLATTSIDPTNLYGIGQGSGLYKIDLSSLTKISATLVSPQFAAVGDLRISDGIAYATEGNTSSGVYTKVRGLDIAKHVDLFTPISVSGRDGIAVAPNASTLYAASEVTDQSNNVFKYVNAYNMTTGKLITSNIAVFGGAFQMENFVPTGQLLLAVQGDYSVRLLDVATNKVASQYLLPMQVDPEAIATDGTNTYVLNYASNTITSITQSATLLKPTYDTSALVKDLAAYRAKALEAFAELVGGLAQYLKDCLCDHLLVNSPTPMENKLYLAAVRIRGKKVDKICNLTKRRYVKSFPTVGYWLSLWPVIPMMKWAIAQFCCAVIPDATAKIKGGTGGSGATVGQAGSNPIEKLQDWLDRIQGTDPFAFLGTIVTLISGKNSMGMMVADAFLPSQGAAPASAPLVATNYQPAGRVAGGKSIVGQPTAGTVGTLTGSGVAVEVLPYQPSPGGFARSVASFFTDPVPGSTVTLYEEGGIVRAYELQPQGPSADVQHQVLGLSASLQARDVQIGQLQNQLNGMQVQQAQLLATQRQHLEMVNALRAIVEGRGGGGIPPAGGPPAGGPPAGGPPAGGPPVGRPPGGAPVVGGPPLGGPVAGGPAGGPRLMAVDAPQPAAGSADPIDAFLAATVVRVDRVAYHQSGFGPIGAAQRERTNFCVPKAAGQLGFTIDTVRDLGLSPDYQVQLALQGRVAGNTPTGDPIVEWSLDQVVGREFRVLGVPVHVDAVVGTVRASLQAVTPPRPGEDCQGEPRSFTVALVPDPQGGGRLSAHARALAMELTVDLSSIAVAGWAGTE
jgi:hypothetical protein